MCVLLLLLLLEAQNRTNMSLT